MDPKRTLNYLSTLSLDFDGVVTRPHAIKGQELGRLGYAATEAQTERQFAVERLGVPLDQYEEAAFRANCPRLGEIQPERGSCEAIAELRRLGASPVIVTARGPDELHYVEEFIARHQLSIDNVRPTSRRSKADALREIGAVLHIDDSPRHLLQIRDSLPDLEVLLFANEANRWWIDECAEGVLTIGGWSDLVSRLRNLVGSA